MPYDDEPVEVDRTEQDELDEWWAWHLESEHEPQLLDGPPLRATITVDPGDYL